MDSNQDINYQLGALPLGQYGVDLRRPPAAPALAALDNARFLDERTAIRRNGFLGTTLIDGSAFPGAGGAVSPAPWLYGLGQSVNGVHHPIAGRGAAVFELDAPVAWTGDRLLLPTSADHGTSAVWTGNTGVAAAQGLPAYLPLMVDTPANNQVSDANSAVASALTEQYELYAVATATKVTATLVNRAGGVLPIADITGTSSLPEMPVALVVSGVFHVMWLDSSDNKLRFRRYVGGAWTAEDVLFPTAVSAYAAATSTDGATLVLVVLASAVTTIVKRTWQAQVSTHAVTLTAAPAAASGLGLMIDEWDNAFVAFANSGGNVLVNIAVGALVSGTPTTIIVAQTNEASVIGAPAITGITRRGPPRTILVGSPAVTHNIASFAVYWSTIGGLVAPAIQVSDQSGTSALYYNMAPASKPWTVGAESFIWLVTVSRTNLLIAGISDSTFVAGAADDEISAFSGSNVATSTAVSRDPLDPTGATWLWARPYVKQFATLNTGIMLGLINFLPQLSTAAYGKSMYLSGSAVKNWDGIALVDAGFHDIPVAVANNVGTSGSLTTSGAYEWRVKAVRYNNKGERFESPANTTAIASLSGTAATVQINGVMCTDRAGVALEIYRTTNAGSTFFLEGIVANPTATRNVTWTSTISDAVLENGNEEDSTAPGGEIESAAPTGCAYLATSGDRLWGAGGQVPAGRAIFSKRIDDGFGAGFDLLAGFIDFATVAEPVTSIASVNDAEVISTPTRWYVLGGLGPDNFGNGSYAAPQMSIAVGAISAYGTVLAPIGLAYWSAGGPALLPPNFQTQFVADPVRTLAETLTPVGVQIDTPRQEIVWLCAEQNGVSRALLMNYATGTPRWATWTLPAIAAASPNYLITPDGVLLQESVDAFGDNGAPFAFQLKTGNVDPQQLLSGATRVRRVGVTGDFTAAHKLRMRVYYDGSPGWNDDFTWDPTANTWLTAITAVAGLTPAEVDAMPWADKSGKYRMSNRVSRQECSYLQVEISDISSAGQTFLPYEIAFELGVPRQGFGRGVVQNIQRAQ